MSQLSQGYVDKVVRWSTSGVELDKMHMSLDQKFRARLCLECYRLFTENPAVPVRTIVKNIAQRDYRMLTENARLGNQDAVEMMPLRGSRLKNIKKRVLTNNKTIAKMILT